MSTPHLQRICSVAETEEKEQRAGLRAALEALQARPSAEFVATLDERKRQERQWANFSRHKRLVNSSGETQEQHRANAKWYSTTQLSLEYRNAWLAEKVPGKVFLEYACGDGLETLKAAQMGGALAIDIDVSNVSIANATEAAAREGLSDKCVFIEGDCEDTGLPEGSVDVILCSYMLHHLDLNYAYPEMHRILKPGGCVLACEALNYNPLIKLCRKLTPEKGTYPVPERRPSGQTILQRRLYSVLAPVQRPGRLPARGASAVWRGHAGPEPRRSPAREDSWGATDGLAVLF